MANILGVHGFDRVDGTSERIVSYAGDAFVWSGTAWTPQNQYLHTTAKTEFATFLDGLFMANYENTTRFYNGSTWSATTNVTDAPKFKYLKVYGTRLYGGYCDISGTAYPSRIVRSDLPSSGTISWTPDDEYFDVRTDDGDVIKGLGENANRLLIFKENTLHSYDGSTLYQVRGAPGTTSHRSIINDSNNTWLFYFHRDGVYRFDGSRSELISRPIEPWIDGIAASFYDDVVAWADRDNIFFYVDDITNVDEDIDISNGILMFDIAQEKWSVGSLPFAVTCATRAIESGAPVYFVGSDTAGVYQMNTGNTDDGDAIPWQAETGIIYPTGDPDILSRYKKVFVNSTRNSGLRVQYKLIGKPYENDTEWKSLRSGTLARPVEELFFPLSDPRARGIKFLFSGSRGTSSPVVKRLSFEYEPEGTE